MSETDNLPNSPKSFFLYLGYVRVLSQSIFGWMEALPHYDIESLRIKPDRSSWSMGQLYMHILHETTWYFEQIELCFDRPEHADKEMLESAKTMFHNNSFPDENIKGDPLLSENVKQPADREALLYAFQQLKADANRIWVKIETLSWVVDIEHIKRVEALLDFLSGKVK